MASTFDNNLRLREMGTGDESGTWGNRTNENLELIGEALGYGTEAITTNADLHTTTVSNGATAPGRAMYLKYTGTLDSACTITLAPNTISKSGSSSRFPKAGVPTKYWSASKSSSISPLIEITNKPSMVKFSTFKIKPLFLKLDGIK